MLKRFITHLPLSVILLVPFNSNALQVTLENDATTLAENLVGSGVSVFDANFIGDPLQSGFFSDGISSGFGIDSGIIFSTGSVLNAIGPNTAAPSTVDFGNPGSGSVSGISGFPSFDLASLSFDFEINNSFGGDLIFSLVFGSEEYNEFVNTQFNDAFLFSIDGVNQAVLPDGNAVSVNSINRDLNSDLFVDNTANVFDTNIDGFTNLLTFQVSGLDAGVHTAEFSIADSSDGLLDSWVLFGADTFVGVTPVPEFNTTSASTGVLFILSMLLLLNEQRSRRLIPVKQD